MSTILTPVAGHTVAVPFQAFPVGANISFIIFLASGAGGNGIVAQSSQTPAKAATGGQDLTPPATINLTGVAPGDYYTGVVPFIGAAGLPAVMLAPGTDVIIQSPYDYTLSGWVDSVGLHLIVQNNNIPFMVAPSGVDYGYLNYCNFDLRLRLLKTANYAWSGYYTGGYAALPTDSQGYVTLSIPYLPLSGTGPITTDNYNSNFGFGAPGPGASVEIDLALPMTYKMNVYNASNQQMSISDMISQGYLPSNYGIVVESATFGQWRTNAPNAQTGLYPTTINNPPTFPIIINHS